MSQKIYKIVRIFFFILICFVYDVLCGILIYVNNNILIGVYMRCEGCGAQINHESKMCEYCKAVVNSGSKDLDVVSVECFVVEDIFILVKNTVVVGRALQPLNVGDTVCYGGNMYTITSIQVNRSIVNGVKSGENCGIVINGFCKNDFSRGAVLVTPKN